jgi:hypothetical protein
MPEVNGCAVFTEAGSKRVFASALDWPGWARSGKSEEEALATLADYLDRYAPVVRRAGLKPPSADGLVVAERAQGKAKNADFGALGEIAASERGPLSATEGKRIAALLEAAWAEFDEVVAGAPATLRKGPRGGGRDTAQIVDHVIGVEPIYARKMGIAQSKVDPANHAAVEAMRQVILAALTAGAPSLAAESKDWPLRYGARRIAWHALDHAWEIQDKSEPA